MGDGKIGNWYSHWHLQTLGGRGGGDGGGDGGGGGEEEGGDTQK